MDDEDDETCQFYRGTQLGVVEKSEQHKMALQISEITQNSSVGSEWQETHKVTVVVEVVLVVVVVVELIVVMLVVVVWVVVIGVVVIEMIVVVENLY